MNFFASLLIEINFLILARTHLVSFSRRIRVVFEFHSVRGFNPSRSSLRFVLLSEFVSPMIDSSLEHAFSHLLLERLIRAPKIVPPTRHGDQGDECLNPNFWFSLQETLKPASVPLSAVLVKRSLSKTSLNEIGLQQSRSVEEGEEELVKEEALNYQSAREKFQEMVKTTTTTFRTSSSGDIIPSKSVNILPDGSPEQPRESEGMSTPSDAVHRTEVHHPVNSSIYRGPPSTGGTFRSASSNLSNGSLPRQPSEQRTPSPTSLNKLPVRDQILRLSRMPSAQLNRYMQGRDDSDEDVEAEDKPNPWRTQTSSVSTAISSPSPSADEYRTPPTRPVPFSSPAIVATKDTAVPLTKANIFDAPVAPVANGLGSGSSVRTSAPAFTITSAKPQIQPSSILDGGPTPPSRRTPPYKPPSTGGGLRFGPETPTPSNTGFQQPKKSILLVDKAKTGGLGRQRHQTPPKEVHFEKVEPFRHSSGGSLTNGGGPRGMSPQPRSVRFASGDEPPRDTPKVIGFQQSPVSSIPAPPPPPMPSPAAEGGPPPPPMNEFEKVKMNLGTTSKRIVPTNREVTRNPRDVLMESIRDFGKRGQLKSPFCREPSILDVIIQTYRP
ncbi:unnamed protein product [Cyprideis torosa]|uniref:Uncharacterized protein n=1 Tax=Cyprideis torosa TaxID=163714 RepID=A0A7R8WF56_9CRUS|nr:unnamed protein product [Cyprideis torosa]CAG0891515.1 unnamed protein product [Cyprideis torosa]